MKPTHRHYKGGLYQVVMAAQHTETGERLMIYRDEYGREWPAHWTCSMGACYSATGATCGASSR